MSTPFASIDPSVSVVRTLIAEKIGDDEMPAGVYVRDGDSWTLLEDTSGPELEATIVADLIVKLISHSRQVALVASAETVMNAAGLTRDQLAVALRGALVSCSGQITKELMDRIGPKVTGVATVKTGKFAALSRKYPIGGKADAAEGQPAPDGEGNGRKRHRLRPE